MPSHRQRLAEAIQADGPGFSRPAILTGWVLVAEWMDDDGLKWLSKDSGDAAGEPMSKWTIAGFHHEALNTDWHPADDDDT